MRILGIDPGSRATGYGLLADEEDGLRCLGYGTLRAPASAELPERLHHIWQGLYRLIQAEQPQVVAVEEVFHAVNTRSALVLGHVRGVALLAAVQSECSLVAYSPAEIKKAVVGYGRADKQQIQAMVKLLLKLDRVPESEDAADALAVAICHAHSARLKEAAPRSGRRSCVRTRS